MILDLFVYITLATIVIVVYMTIRRLVKIVNDYEEIHKILFRCVDELNTHCLEVLSQEVLSSNPTIISFVRLVKKIQPVLGQLSKDYTLTYKPAEELPTLQDYGTPQ